MKPIVRFAAVVGILAFAALAYAQRLRFGVPVDRGSKSGGEVSRDRAGASGERLVRLRYLSRTGD
jgi:hypothetical protein